MRIGLVANKVLVAMKQELICKCMAEAFGNIQSSSGGDPEEAGLGFDCHLQRGNFVSSVALSGQNLGMEGEWQPRAWEIEAQKGFCLAVPFEGLSKVQELQHLGASSRKSPCLRRWAQHVFE